jgi:hypothetical protein
MAASEFIYASVRAFSQRACVRQHAGVQPNAPAAVYIVSGLLCTSANGSHSLLDIYFNDSAVVGAFN